MPVANSISLSDITELVVSKVVVEPDTVKLPEITALPDKFNEPPVIAALDISTASFKTKFVLSVVLICLSAIFTVPEVTLVNPAIVVELAPKLIDVEPTVTAEFESDELPIFESVLDEPLIVLFVSVAVVSLKIKYLFEIKSLYPLYHHLKLKINHLLLKVALVKFVALSIFTTLLHYQILM